MLVFLNAMSFCIFTINKLYTVVFFTVLQEYFNKPLSSVYIKVLPDPLLNSGYPDENINETVITVINY